MIEDERIHDPLAMMIETMLTGRGRSSEFFHFRGLRQEDMDVKGEAGIISSDETILELRTDHAIDCEKVSTTSSIS